MAAQCLYHNFTELMSLNAVLSTRLPVLPTDQMRILHNRLGKILMPYLSSSQQEYVQFVGITENSLKRAVGRCLARMLAAFYFPEIYLDTAVKPVCKEGFLCFSYSETFVFCIISQNYEAAIDAEEQKTQIPAIRNFFKKFCSSHLPEFSGSLEVRAWVLFEAIFKLTENYQIAATHLADFFSGKLLEEKGDICWKIFPFMEHWLCTAYRAEVLPDFCIYHLPWQKLANFRKK